MRQTRRFRTTLPLLAGAMLSAGAGNALAASPVDASATAVDATAICSSVRSENASMEALSKTGKNVKGVSGAIAFYTSGEKDLLQLAGTLSEFQALVTSSSDSAITTSVGEIKQAAADYGTAASELKKGDTHSVEKLAAEAEKDINAGVNVKFTFNSTGSASKTCTSLFS